MAWVRRGGRLYQYRSVRRGGRVTPEYIGRAASGDLAEQLAEVDRALGASARLERSERVQERARLDELGRLVAEVAEEVRTMADAAMLAAGFRRHDRGRWRRARAMKSNGATVGERGGVGDHRAVVKVTTGPEMSVWLDELDGAAGDEKSALQERIAAEVDDLLVRAKAGGRSALRALRVFVERRPQHLGRMDLAGYATRALANHAADGDVFLFERFTKEIERVRDELAGPAPTPLERLLAERVALTWFDATDADTRISANAANANAEFHGRYRERANRRFLQAARTFATVKKLARPEIRINVAENQVNVG